MLQSKYITLKQTANGKCKGNCIVITVLNFETDQCKNCYKNLELLNFKKLPKHLPYSGNKEEDS